jgi:hypothetical protein
MRLSCFVWILSPARAAVPTGLPGQLDGPINVAVSHRPGGLGYPTPEGAVEVL